jgi:YfiH family protein
MNRNNLFLRPDWPAPDNIHAATTLRTGGHSLEPYDSLNMAMHVGDDSGKVKLNRDKVKAGLNLPNEPLWLTQTHSTIAVEATSVETTAHADASYTAKPNTVCVVMTADCLPILLCATDGSEIAAIHAGWRGLVDGILDNTVAALTAQTVMAWLGPAIGSQHFEVGEDVCSAYLARSKAYQCGFIQITPDKWLADIYTLASVNLRALGISLIFGGGQCTYTDRQHYFSYRRDKTTGRMATFIWRD